MQKRVIKKSDKKAIQKESLCPTSYLPSPANAEILHTISDLHVARIITSGNHLISNPVSLN